MSVEMQLRRFNSMERRPRMLKEFLSENLSSCSSSGFNSFPRKPPNGVVSPSRNSMHNHIQMELNSYNSSSKSTFQTLMNTIRSISFFNSVRKSPSVLSLPRSLSRKLRRSQGCKESSEIKISTVKIKDIIRWKSFRDLVEDHNLHQQPSLPSPPLSPSDFCRCTTESTFTTTAVTTCSSSSCGSSWSDGDFFTATWEAQNDSVEAGKKLSFSPFFVAKDSVAPYEAAVGAKEVLTCQEDEQHSPVSVLQVGEDEFSLFDQSLANIERRKQKFIQTVPKFESLAKFDLADLDQCLSLDENSDYDEDHEDDDDKDKKVEEQDWVGERAKKLLHCVKATGSSVQKCKDYLDTVLLDFFREELTGSINQDRNGEEFEWEILGIAEDWINGSFTYDIGHVDKDAYIKDMDRRVRWSKFEEEQGELILEIETAILHSLVDDLLDLDG